MGLAEKLVQLRAAMQRPRGLLPADHPRVRMALLLSRLEEEDAILLDALTLEGGNFPRALQRIEREQDAFKPTYENAKKRMARLAQQLNMVGTPHLLMLWHQLQLNYNAIPTDQNTLLKYFPHGTEVRTRSALTSSSRSVQRNVAGPSLAARRSTRSALFDPVLWSARAFLPANLPSATRTALGRFVTIHHRAWAHIATQSDVPGLDENDISAADNVARSLAKAALEFDRMESYFILAPTLIAGSRSLIRLATAFGQLPKHPDEDRLEVNVWQDTHTGELSPELAIRPFILWRDVLRGLSTGRLTDAKLLKEITPLAELFFPPPGTRLHPRLALCPLFGATLSMLQTIAHDANFQAARPKASSALRASIQPMFMQARQQRLDLLEEKRIDMSATVGWWAAAAAGIELPKETYALHTAQEILLKPTEVDDIYLSKDSKNYSTLLAPESAAAVASGLALTDNGEAGIATVQ